MDLIEQCWHQGPTKRPTIGEILEKIAIIKSSITPGSHQLTKCSPAHKIVHSVVEEIPSDELKKLELIAEGGFGKVYTII